MHTQKWIIRTMSSVSEVAVDKHSFRAHCINWDELRTLSRLPLFHCVSHFVEKCDKNRNSNDVMGTKAMSYKDKNHFYLSIYLYGPPINISICILYIYYVAIRVMTRAMFCLWCSVAFSCCCLPQTLSFHSAWSFFMIFYELLSRVCVLLGGYN